MPRKLHVTQYGTPDKSGYVGHVEPSYDIDKGERPSWIIHFRSDGSGTLFTARSIDGSVTLDEGVNLPASDLDVARAFSPSFGVAKKANPLY